MILNQGHTYDSECISDTNKYSVIIGGTLLSRGVTFKYLSTELILNSPDVSSFAIDTMMQRARWLGYRLDKQEYMTVIMSDKIYNGYKEATETFIKFNKYLKKNYKDIKIIKRFLLETQKDHLDKINLKWTNKPMGK